ncbi:MAG: hypothetical protein HOW97_03690 [Catenulispora sp.]|nr:hypothetical protein [Catenulispora sp.]NUR61025.1 hypothetical protein [Catenulispora sp.]
MALTYHSERGWRAAAYTCTIGSASYGQPHRCQTLTARYVDDEVTDWLLAMLAQAGLEVALAAGDRLEAERADEQYAVDRARRCYQLAEPENRLVVRQLEHDWEQALADQRALTEDHDRFIRARPKHLTPDDRAKIAALAGDLPGLWHAASTTDADRKEIVRAVIDKVEVATVGHRTDRHHRPLGRRTDHHRPRSLPGPDPHPAELLPPAAGPRLRARRPGSVTVADSPSSERRTALRSLRPRPSFRPLGSLRHAAIARPAPALADHPGDERRRRTPG